MDISVQEDLVFVADIVFDRPLRKPFSYLIPTELFNSISKGKRVRVPLGKGNKPTIGFCVDTRHIPSDPKLKSIFAIMDEEPLVSTHLLEFTKWIADYYLCGWGQVLQAVVPAWVRSGATTPKVFIVDFSDKFHISSSTKKFSPQQTRIFEQLNLLHPITIKELCIKSACTPSVVNRLVETDWLVKTAIDEGQAFFGALQTIPLDPSIHLNDEQIAVSKTITDQIHSGKFCTFLLHGVTGSGKTEVYLEAIEATIKNGRQAIVMVPEISLTPQTVYRFKKRFSKIVVLHSNLREAERGKNWKLVAEGKVDVVIGPRSTVFAPCPNLGLIVIDEEHENSFKQDNTPRYHGRDIAVKRARMLDIPIVLGSATPSFESWHNACKNNYKMLTLSKRVRNLPMPPVYLVDMKTSPPASPSLRGMISEDLQKGMKRALSQNGQVMLFLNRRGFHTFIQCPTCKTVENCKHCDLAMTFHKRKNILLCHHCGDEKKPDKRCETCKTETIQFKGMGTEKLEEEITKLFPDKVIRRMDSDSTTKPGSHEYILNAFREGLINILVGTQMIAKGLDFPNVLLVGVINPDTGIHIPDFRASERTFQLLSQVAGRTGRGDKPGMVYFQTYYPEHPAIVSAAKHDFISFVDEEIKHRQSLFFPPFCRLARIVIRSKSAESAATFSDELGEQLRLATTEIKGSGKLKILGPTEAPVFKLKEYHRFHVQLHAEKHTVLHQLIQVALGKMKPISGLEVIVDIDPYNLL